ncbi:MAG: DUF4239 domain-containing protein [Dehalococcoidia bacterium]
MLVLEGLVIFALILVPALLGVILVQRYFPTSLHQFSFAAAEPIWAILGVTYGLLLAFIVVNLWTDLQSAQGTVQDEANDLVILYELTYGLPEAAAPVELRGEIFRYARLIADEEWPLLGEHESSPRADAAMDALWMSYLRLDTMLMKTNTSYEESLSLLSELQSARNRRIDAAHNLVPTVLWVVLLSGVALMIVTIWFTGPEDLRTHLLMAAVLGISLASILFLIRAFNNPFQGDVRVNADPIERAVERFQE